jgi:hypothetical protein
MFDIVHIRRVCLVACDSSTIEGDWWSSIFEGMRQLQRQTTALLSTLTILLTKYPK